MQEAVLGAFVLVLVFRAKGFVSDDIERGTRSSRCADCLEVNVAAVFLSWEKLSAKLPYLLW